MKIDEHAVIIAIDEHGYGHIMEVTDEYRCCVLKLNDWLDKHIMDLPSGVWGCSIVGPADFPAIAVNRPLYTLPKKNIVTLIVQSYRFNSNDYLAVTDDMEVVVFDPYVNGAIIRTDEDYYNQVGVNKIVGATMVCDMGSYLPNLKSPEGKTDGYRIVAPAEILIWKESCHD